MANNKNKMGTAPVPGLLFSMAVPLMLSLLVQSLYNIVDSMFVSRISETALTATSLAYPVQMLMIALGVGTSVGINALLSRLLGMGRHDEAGRAATTGIILAVLSSVPFMIGGIFADGIAGILADNAKTGSMCAGYLRICMLLSIGTFTETMFQRFLQASGRTLLSMVSLVVGAGANIILDPVMIFGYFGMPALGIQGAAIATVIGQWLGALTAILLNTFCNPDVKPVFKGFRLRLDTVLQIYKVGLPTIVTQAMGSVMNFSMNALLQSYSGTAVAFFGVYFKLQGFLFMPVNGLGQAMIPIIGFNYGARNGNRVREVYRTGMPAGMIISLIATAVFMLLPDKLLGIFSASDAMLSIGVHAIRVICVTFVLSAVTSLCGYAASGLGNGMINMIGTGLRQVVLLLPAAALLLKTCGIMVCYVVL